MENNVHDCIAEIEQCCKENPKFAIKVERELVQDCMAVHMFVQNEPVSARNQVVRLLPYKSYAPGEGECVFYEMAWRLMVMRSFPTA